MRATWASLNGRMARTSFRRTPSAETATRGHFKRADRLLATHMAVRTCAMSGTLTLRPAMACHATDVMFAADANQCAHCVVLASGSGGGNCSNDNSKWKQSTLELGDGIAAPASRFSHGGPADELGREMRMARDEEGRDARWWDVAWQMTDGRENGD